ncbi:alpha/beta hydrolase family protein, partial [Bacteroidota bacterium]
RVDLSVGGKYIIWYEKEDSNFYSHGVETGELTCLTCDIEADFYDSDHDKPSLPGSYGLAGFTKGDESVLIYSRYDIWKIDPSGNKLPINLTGQTGSNESISYRYRHLEYDDPFIPLKKSIFLEGFNEATKETWIYSSSALLSMKPVALSEGNYHYKLQSRARNADVLCWSKEDFDEYPDVYVSDPEFKQKHKISDANPQAVDYYWGSANLVHWTSYAGDDLDGILYIPEDFNPEKKYPMLVYFYEKRSERLHWHVSPAPSRSSLNFALAVSKGYVVFVPDIPYRTGNPGQSAYDAVVSGAIAMCDQFSFIDRDNIGIDGQSWGGYQVAWLITRTNLFKAAMAGAPVSNMISAYGGIRWESGRSRMMQYEDGQSRIGGTLWQETDLYIENSPIFRVPEIETPLLIMHNDNDGAVPWYQGIELFVAMRRLNKPAWMLVYNDEAHNLSKWPNKVDLSIRMTQFFDHYLKGAPVPEWMATGIPAIDKGKTDGYRFMESEDK